VLYSLNASYLLLRQLTLHLLLCTCAAAERQLRDDNESEMILGDPWDKSGSLGVKSALLGSTRYHSCSKSCPRV
jgi:hypothetical protein